jgi:hypothetical protein
MDMRTRSEERRVSFLPNVPLAETAFPGELMAVGDRGRAGRMTPDDVVIVWKAYRAGFVSQRDVAQMVHAEYCTL